MKTLIVVAFVSFLSAAALCVGFCSGLALGRWWGEWELHYLMAVPSGGMVLSHRTDSTWLKLDNNTLRFMRVPDPRQARVAQIFPSGPKKEEEKKDEKADSTGKPGTSHRGK